MVRRAFLSILPALAFAGQNPEFANRYDVSLAGHGTMDVVDGRVVFRRTRGEGPLWRIRSTDKGYFVWRGGYLTGHKDGRVTLSKEPVDGSYWSLTISTNGSTYKKAPMLVRGRKDGPRYLTADDKHEATLSEKEGPVFKIVVIAP
jgi:hypothetical protein